MRGERICPVEYQQTRRFVSRRNVLRPLSFPRDSISTHTLCLLFAITERIYHGVHRLCHEPRRVAYYVRRAALSIDVFAVALAARQLPREFTVANAPISVPRLLSRHYPWTADWFRSHLCNNNNEFRRSWQTCYMRPSLVSIPSDFYLPTLFTVNLAELCKRT